MPPGNILQSMFLNEQLSSMFKDGIRTFIEVGSGNGNISESLLEYGFTGKGYDLNASACDNNRTLNKQAVDEQRYSVVHSDFIASEGEKVDLIISCMVIEHMPRAMLDNYMTTAVNRLNPGERLVSIVPSSMRYWGIEDEIAGHIKRYEFSDFNVLGQKYRLDIIKISGLTFPLSNLLIGVSNKLVAEQESDKLLKSQKEKTIDTGNRNVKYKTTFPKVFNIFLNPIVMYPWHVLQKMSAKNPKSMVIYCEMKKP